MKTSWSTSSVYRAWSTKVQNRLKETPEKRRLSFATSSFATTAVNNGPNSPTNRRVGLPSPTDSPNMEADGISLKHIYESIPEHPHIYDRLRIETDPLPLSADNQHYQILRFSDNSTEEDPFSTLRRNSIFARKFVQHQNNTKNLYSVITFNRVELLWSVLSVFLRRKLL